MIKVFCYKYLPDHVLPPDAVLSCVFRTERDQNPRIEWKKKDKDVSFVYFQGHFRGEKATCRSLSPWLQTHLF